ncbi:minor coat protein [Thermus phage Zuza8]
MDPYAWFLQVLAYTGVPYALLVAYRYTRRLYGSV